MSTESTLVSAAHFAYVAARTERDDAFLLALKDAARAAGVPPIWIAPEQASLMQILIKLVRAREVIEVGTLAGYSAIRMARALPEGGRVRTIEIDPVRHEFARRWAAQSDVASRVECHLGVGLEILTSFATGSADAAFLDADKQNYGPYLEESLRIVRSGGLMMVDNAFAFGQLLWEQPTDREAPAVRAFNERMALDARIQSVIVPIGDGLWVGVKR